MVAPTDSSLNHNNSSSSFNESPHRSTAPSSPKSPRRLRNKSLPMGLLSGISGVGGGSASGRSKHHNHHMPFQKGPSQSSLADTAPSTASSNASIATSERFSTILMTSPSKKAHKSSSKKAIFSSDNNSNNNIDDTEDHSHSLYDHSHNPEDLLFNLDDGDNPHEIVVLDEQQLRQCDEDDLTRVRDEITSQEARRVDLRHGLVAHTERAKARYEMGNQKGALISMKHVKRLELELSNMETTLQYLGQLEQDLLRQQQRPEQPPPQDQQPHDQQDTAPTTSPQSPPPESEHDSLDALYSSVSSLNMQMQLHNSVMDIDYELDRILNTHMDSASHLQLSEVDLLRELAEMTIGAATSGNNNNNNKADPHEDQEKRVEI